MAGDSPASHRKACLSAGPWSWPWPAGVRSALGLRQKLVLVLGLRGGPEACFLKDLGSGIKLTDQRTSGLRSGIFHLPLPLGGIGV